jgi:adenosine kinase
MSLLISGSIAFDTIIQTVGDFRSQDTQKIGDLHLSLFSPTIRKEYGGTAANIAYSLALLGKTPTIIGSVGEDANNYLIRLREL